jgi:thiazole synthase ThiGH ThiG subunit
MQDAPFVLAGRIFASRLIVGTGNDPSFTVMAQARQSSPADLS